MQGSSVVGVGKGYQNISRGHCGNTTYTLEVEVKFKVDNIEAVHVGDVSVSRRSQGAGWHFGVQLGPNIDVHSIRVIPPVFSRNLHCGNPCLDLD